MSETESVIARLAAADITVDEEGAAQALLLSREAKAAPAFRGPDLGDVEPMAPFDPRWR
jgi:hypothetical protein